MITLTTSRLTMRPIDSADWPLFLTLYQTPSVMKYIGDIEKPAQVRSRFEQRLGRWDKYADFWLCLVITERETGEAVGLTGFFPDWRPYQQAEVGFMLLPAYQGKGYGQESLREVLNYAFNICGFHRLQANVIEGNIASRRLLERCGFRLEGTLRESYRMQGEWQNDWLLALLCSDYVKD
ncbi:MAG: GNAT family N-acetyltransferase [Rouxiella aceris]|uniref:GNAT family N-acetyltransferase n=1 Tax=Rouxiella aceris TaxID=2703884 RepID=UPI00284E5483|nr:GNAT family N-acetyltransferase [Rouxiella aceris]MDR3431279.1 GNAT family N-acetyltransferase [Rouxiella aceris]